MKTVYGVLLNFRSEADAWASKMSEAPYKAPPQAPVLYVKPANTWSGDGSDVPVPAHVDEVEIGATIGMVMRGAGDVAGYVLMNDLFVPHDSYFRPPVRFKCFDGFLGVGSVLMEAADAPDPSQFVLEVRVNGDLKQTIHFDQLVRPPAQLLADVGSFMTLSAGEVLMLGLDAGRPRARVGDRIELRTTGLGTLVNTLVAEAA